MADNQTLERQQQNRSSAENSNQNKPGTASFPARLDNIGSAEEATDEVKAHLGHREGYRRDVYYDSEHKLTAGVGHLLSSSEKSRYPFGSIVPDSVIRQWQVEDTRNAYASARQQAREIGADTQAMVNGLTAVNFQLGTAWNTKFKKTWSLLKSQSWVEAAHEAADSLWFKQTPVRVFDFQRVLLQYAGHPTDYDSMVEFNAADIRDRRVSVPNQENVESFALSEGASNTHVNSSPTTESESSESTNDPGLVQLKMSVGLKTDGKSYVGESSDVKWVQQQLVYAGYLNSTVTNSQGQEISNVDGLLGNVTISAIKDFQSNELKFRNSDGRVDIGGRTYNALAKYSAQKDSAPTTDSSSEVNQCTPDMIEPPAQSGGTNQSEAEQTPDNNHSNDTELDGPQSESSSAMTFENVPAAFADKYKIRGSVGRSGNNNSGDIEIMNKILRMLGYRVTLMKNYKYASTRRTKRGIQMANSVFHFQMRHANISNDARTDPNGGTWKQMILSAYQATGGENVTEAQLQEIHDRQKGSRSDVSSSIIPQGVNKGYLLGVDNSGYLLPQEFKNNALILKENLEKIRAEVGNFSISCGYRSPAHNVKIGSDATMSKHVIGQAADIQTMSGHTNTSLYKKINKMMDRGIIKRGKALKYTWGVHYDVR